MKRNAVKIIAIALIAILAIASVTTRVYAEGISYGTFTEKNVTRNAHDNSGAASSVNNMIGAALTVVQVVGSGVAVIMLIVLAIKYISAAPSDKAEIKKHAVVYVVGAVVLFAASGIIGIVRNFAGNVRAEGSGTDYNADTGIGG